VHTQETIGCPYKGHIGNSIELRGGKKEVKNEIEEKAKRVGEYTRKYKA